MVFAKIYVTGTCARVTELKKLTSGLAGGKILVDYEDHIWAGLSKTVVFRGIVEKDVLTDKTAVEIPWEVLDKPCKHLWVGFYGTNSDKNMIIPTVYADLGPVLPGADPSGDESTDPSLPVWAQLQNQIDDLRENGSPGGGGSVEDGGYYTPSVKQPDRDTLQFNFATSKADMPAIEPVEVTLPAGPQGDAYTLTEADKEEIAELAADLVEVPDSGGNVDLTGVVKSVNGQTPDENGNVQISVSGGGGLSATASALLINILRNAVYTADQSANITALENALFNGGTAPDVPVAPDNPDEPDEPVVTKYTIVSALLHATSNNASASVEAGASYTATITAEDGYTLDGATVSVSMGGVDITATAYANGVVTIGSVTGNVIITVNAVVKAASDILYALPETTVFDGTEASVIDTGVQLFKDDIDWSIAFTANFNNRGCIFDCRTEASSNRGIYATGFTYNNGDWNKTVGGWYFDKQWSTNNVGPEDKLHEDKNVKVVLTHIAGTNDVVSSLYYGTTRFADKTDTYTAGFASSDKTLSIGARFNDSITIMKYDMFFTGTIFDFTVYNRVLSADEITAYMGA